MSQAVPRLVITRVWRKSSFSEGANGCVELAVAGVESPPRDEAHVDRLYLVRDSKVSDGPVLACAPGEWAAFIGGVKDGEFRPPA
ncbi:DUF397 domain-containing protein [Sphaerisporangium dianthi]|uniref:DUF397 domain-containing protein n=1 Tax=Sphaerisporangium dianthi TaxID=1436120 RepID=A0ABV9CP10_9ACTN